MRNEFLWRRFRNRGSSQQRAVQPRLERLEERETPAGNVTTSFSGGTLTIAGVDDTSEIGVLDKLNDQQLLVAGVMQGKFTVTGLTGTTVDGMPAKTFSGVNNIRFDMRQGDDTVSLNSAVVSGTLTFNGGAGDDTLNIDNIAGPQSFGAVTLNGGDDSDSLAIGNGSATIAGALTFNGGSGNSKITIGVLGTDELRVGRVSVVNGNGNDTFLAAGAKFLVGGGGMTINNGISGNTVTNVFSKTVALDGNLAITNLAGGDVITLGSAAGTFVGEGVTINNGDGVSLVNFAAKSTLSSIAITNGTGFDKVTLGSMTVSGNVSINNRNGGSATVITGDTVVTDGNLSLASGAGDDTLAVDSKALTVHGALNVNTGAGTSALEFTPASLLTVDRAVTINTGGDADAITFGTLLTGSSLGGVNINVGNGGSAIAFIGLVEVNGNLAVNGREGVDEFSSSGGSLTVTGNTGLNLGTGANSVSFLALGTVVEGSLTVNGVDGADAFKTAGFAFTVNKTANISAGDGDSALSFSSLENNFKGPLSINGRGGRNALSFEHTLNGRSVTINSSGGAIVSFAAGGDVAIDGNLNVTTGSESDIMKMAGTLFISGSMSLNTGGGSDLLELEPAGGTIMNGVTIRTGDGADAVTLSTLTFAGSVNIDLGGLHDDLDIDNCHFFGPSLSINSGAGSDLVHVEQADTGAPSEFTGTVTIRLGGGDDILVIGRDGEFDDIGKFSKAVTIDGGAGLDIAAILSPADGGSRHNDFEIFPTFLGIEAST